ncbi:MAG: hypothetical protein GTN76_01635 [Candidatus Aenigmarchaeota archaeon]|nr:hypothetical protein [Candidatus Aenigmarchaeota archaeon]
MIFQYVSGLREESENLSVNEVFDFAMKIASKYLNGKKIKILRIIATQKEPTTITSAVDQVSRTLCCPKSTVWMNVNFLKELGLIENGRGRPVRVTAVGRIILENTQGGGEVNG